MIYPFSLFQVGLIVGLALILSHSVAFFAPEGVSQFLRKFPRSIPLGRVLLVVTVVWSWWLVSVVDLGEFSHLRRLLQIGVPAGGVLAWMFVDEFLAVRALGTLALLAAEPVLSAAFLQEPASRLLLVILAYAWILVGLFLVGMPYLLRDFITALTAKKGVFRIAAVAGIGYGIALVVCSILFWAN